MKKGLETKLGACYYEFYNWSYCSHNKSWYEDEVEALSQPETKTDTSRFDFVICVGQLEDDVISDDYEEIEEYVNSLFSGDPYDDACLSSNIAFISDTRRASGHFSPDGICEIDKMIKELKQKDSIFYYIEPYCQFKFITWKLSNKQTRFAVFDYLELSDRYLQCVFDITAPKDVIISKLEGVVETW